MMRWRVWVGALALVGLGAAPALLYGVRFRF
jgi:hypothetical protein